jgi:hypothetical protein
VESPDELLVVYEALYVSEWLVNSKADFTVRPIEMFTGQVEINGKTMQRFELVSNPKSLKI